MPLVNPKVGRILVVLTGLVVLGCVISPAIVVHPLPAAVLCVGGLALVVRGALWPHPVSSSLDEALLCLRLEVEQASGRRQPVPPQAASMLTVTGLVLVLRGVRHLGPTSESEEMEMLRLRLEVEEEDGRRRQAQIEDLERELSTHSHAIASLLRD